MTAQDIRDFQARDWQLIERAKSDYWLRQKAAMTPGEALHLAADLHDHVRAVKPDWPNLAEREADLASHARLSDLLQRAARVRPR